MKIGIDARIIFKRGVGRYISNLVFNLLEIDRENQYYLYLDKNSQLKEYIDARNCFLKRLNTANAFLFQQYYLPKAAQKDGVDILHGTDNTIPYIYPFFNKKTIVTIHDTMFIRPLKRAILRPTLKQRLIDMYNKISIPISARKANHIITVSEYSKQDIIKYLKINADKITTIKEAVSDKYRIIRDEKQIKKIKEKYNIIKPYILTSAASDLRKNTERVLEAFKIFNSIVEYKYQLVITSIGEKELRTTNILEKIKELNLEKNVIITGYISDDDLVLLYNGSFIFLFPSIWEGFGLQVLEAFACGVPVITSESTSLVEVAEGSAFFVNPFSVDDIVQALLELEKNEVKREGLREKGLNKIKEFSWKKTAEQTLELYEQVYNNG